jgi:hypothetical protein
MATSYIYRQFRLLIYKFELDPLTARITYLSAWSCKIKGGEQGEVLGV